jgi:hypothetical protein
MRIVLVLELAMNRPKGHCMLFHHLTDAHGEYGGELPELAKA